MFPIVGDAAAPTSWNTARAATNIKPSSSPPPPPPHASHSKPERQHQNINRL